MSKGRSTLRALLVFLGALVGALTVYVILERAPLDPEPPTELILGVQDNTFPAMVYIAQDRGFFQQQGLDVTLRKYSSGRQALLGMFRGENQAATVASTPLVEAAFTREDFRVLCSLGHSDSAVQVVARRDRDIRLPDDLRGRTIGTQRGSAVHFFLDIFLLYHGISESEITIQFMHPEELVPALQRGQVDAISMRSPYTAMAKLLLGDNAVEFTGTALYTQYFTLTAQADFVRGHPRVLRALMRALIQAESYAWRHRIEAIRSVARQLGERRDTEVAADWSLYTFEISLSQSLLLDLERQARWFTFKHPERELVVPNFLSLVHEVPLRSVRPAGVTIRK